MIAPQPPSSRDALVERLFTLFRDGGYEGVSIGDVCAATGLGRSSLYHHFPGGKDDMAQAVIARARDGMERTVLAPLRADGPLAQRLEGMLTGVDAAFAGGSAPCVIASLLVGAQEGPLAAALRALLRDWLDALAGAYAAGGLAPPAAARAAAAVIGRIEGALLLAKALGAPHIFTDALTDIHATALHPDNA